MFWFGKTKRDVEKLKEEVRNSFGSVKDDFSKVRQWIDYFDDKNKKQEEEILRIKEELSSVQSELEDLNTNILFFGKGLSKQTQTAVQKQTAVQPVQTAVQTAVQTGNFLDFSNFTLMERAIIWALINSEMKLSYEDISALLGKDKSTIRGQINGLKRKNEGLIKEIRESNGKKRLYIPDQVKENIVKSVKVRVKGNKKGEKDEKK